ncbi:EDD domain protein, DegV family [Parageobacillus thermantarcticus]|uniref:EDD domain protein, DegV family n=1 Tax=Parageobacillus thermantarcticus TaxID=186116 RepID=A0A1I0SY51_9BACL|nr:DegV family protein [Parageobacillus thermantarcticus]SFA44444.1 EDD domain protein, DegV family [Parageobacillus thermantarcticus]
MKTAVVTDSTAYIPKDVRDRLRIRMIPLSVAFGGETYREEVDISAEQFYEKVKQHKNLPTTSQPAVGEFVELFTSLRDEGYDAVISIHLSSGISGTYQGALTAGNMVDGLKVYAYDSEISCMAQGFYAIEAAKMALDGKTPEEIIARIDEMKKTLRAYFMVDDLAHLQRGGRLTGAQAFIGGLLQIKPLLCFENKVIVPFEKIRTRKKAIKRIEELLAEDAAKGVPLKAAIIHANRPDEAEQWKERLSSLYPNVEFTISYFGPVIATHLGEGALGLTWYQP